MKKFRIFLVCFLLFSLCIFSCRKKEPEAKFLYTIESGGRVTFQNSTSGLVDRFFWDFGTGDTSNEASPKYLYKKSGDYAVELMATNEFGTSSYTEIITITVDGVDPSNSQVTFNNADGVVYAINHFTYKEDNLGNVVEELEGEAIATFFDKNRFYVPAGIVSANGINLDLNTNNTYSFSATDSTKFFGDTTFYFTGDVNWAIYGGNGIPTILQTTKQGFPSMSEILSTATGKTIDEVDVKTDYLVATYNTIVGAESFLFTITDFEGKSLTSDMADCGQYTESISNVDIKSITKD